MLISIIIPVYRVEKYLNKCIESVLRQTYRDFELILVDDGSPDNCGKMCDEWALKDARIIVIHKENGGLSDARNAGLDIAKGEYVAFIDSDDYIEPDMIENLYRLITDNKADMAVCRFIQETENGEIIEDKSIVKPSVYNADEYWTQSFSSNVRTYYNVVWNKLYKKELFAKTRFTKGKLNEDVLIIYDLIKQCKKIAVSDYIGYHYLLRDGSIMQSQKTLKHLAGAEAFLNWAENFCKEEKWGFAAKSLWTYLHRILTEDYGKDWRKSVEYKALKERAKKIYKMIPTNAISRKGRLFMRLYAVNYHLAKKLYMRKICR